jgi:conjugal transfer pilus assembly protein TraL
LDDSRILLLWSMDELMVFYMCLGIGVAIREIMLMSILGVMLLYLYRRFEAGHPDGYVIHALYYNFGIPLKGHSFINPFQRRILR